VLQKSPTLELQSIYL